MLFPPSGYIFPPCIQSPEKSLRPSTTQYTEGVARRYTASRAKGGRPGTTAVVPRRHLLASQLFTYFTIIILLRPETKKSYPVNLYLIILL